MTTWEQVAACWKESDDPDDFDVAVLEEVLPGGKDDASKERRQAIWKAMDNNGNRFVSLAEYDGWFNQHTMAYEGSKGFKPDAGKASIFTYARPCLIRAFNLANGVGADALAGGGPLPHAQGRAEHGPAPAEPRRPREAGRGRGRWPAVVRRGPPAADGLPLVDHGLPRPRGVAVPRLVQRPDLRQERQRDAGRPPPASAPAAERVRRLEARSAGVVVRRAFVGPCRPPSQVPLRPRAPLFLSLLYFLSRPGRLPPTMSAFPAPLSPPLLLEESSLPRRPVFRV